MSADPGRTADGATPAAPHVPLLDQHDAIRTAHEVAERIATGADERDRERLLPVEPLDELSRLGLLAITVPAALGGADLPITVVAEVVRALAVADGSVAQITQPHFTFLDALRRQGTPDQLAHYFGRVLAGERVANAQVERSSSTVVDDATTVRRSGSTGADGGHVLSGTKYYATGSLLAQVLVVRATVADAPLRSDGAPTRVLVYLDVDAPGVRIEDDWNGLGQRSTASGTVQLDDVRVTEDEIVPFNSLFDGPTTYGARAQLLHAAIDTGLARGALTAGVAAAASARPWFEAGVDRAVDDPLLAQVAGTLEVAVRGAEALLVQAGARILEADADLTVERAAEASIATAAAKVAAAQAANDVGSRQFELGGARAAAGDRNLSRYWRDARTHTLHDPERWKVQHIGRWTLSRTPPPRHGQI